MCIGYIYDHRTLSIDNRMTDDKETFLKDIAGITDATHRHQIRVASIKLILYHGIQIGKSISYCVFMRNNSICITTLFNLVIQLSCFH